jgi:hypothetical protein
MSKNTDLIGSVVRALVAAPKECLGLMLDVVNKLSDKETGNSFYMSLKVFVKTGTAEIAAPAATKAAVAADGEVSLKPAPTHKEDLTKFFLEVFGLEVDLEGINLDAADGEIAMFNPNSMAASELVKRGCKYFKIPQPYLYKSLDEVRDTSVRPNGEYVFAYKNSPVRDLPGMSYNEAKKQSLCFLNLVEYILATLFSKWKTGKFLDVSGWTRLDALWPDGGVVSACWLDYRLSFCWDDPGYSYVDGGSRSAVIRPLKP